jgi:hypothetical protein
LTLKMVLLGYTSSATIDRLSNFFTISESLGS